MTDSRPFRTLLALGVSVSLLLSALVPSVLASPPAATATSTSTPYEIAPSSSVRFDLEFYATPPANYSDLQLSAADITDKQGNPILTYGGLIDEVTLTDGTSGSKTTLTNVCSTTAPLFCDFGAVNSDQKITLAVRYDASASATGALSVDFVFMAPGAAPSDKKQKSTKSEFHATDDNCPTAKPSNLKLACVAINNSGNLAGGYFSGPAAITTNNVALSRSNPQNASIPSFNAFGGGALVLKEVNDGDPTETEPICPSGYTCVGQWEKINVADGATFDGGFKVVIYLYGTYPNLSFIHVHDDGITTDYITNTCTFAAGSDTPNELGPDGPGYCKTVTWGQNQTIGTMWVKVNGWGRGI